MNRDVAAGFFSSDSSWDTFHANNPLDIDTRTLLCLVMHLNLCWFCFLMFFFKFKGSKVMHTSEKLVTCVKWESMRVQVENWTKKINEKNLNKLWKLRKREQQFDIGCLVQFNTNCKHENIWILSNNNWNVLRAYEIYYPQHELDENMLANSRELSRDKQYLQYESKWMQTSGKETNNSSWNYCQQTLEACKNENFCLIWIFLTFHHDFVVTIFLCFFLCFSSCLNSDGYVLAHTNENNFHGKLQD